jgi:hypothetical protein
MDSDEKGRQTAAYENGILEEIPNRYEIHLKDDTSQITLMVQYLCEETIAHVDYKEIYKAHLEAVISYFGRSDLKDSYSNGIIGENLPEWIALTWWGGLRHQ